MLDDVIQQVELKQLRAFNWADYYLVHAAVEYNSISFATRSLPPEHRGLAMQGAWVQWRRCAAALTATDRPMYRTLEALPQAPGFCMLWHQRCKCKVVLCRKCGKPKTGPPPYCMILWRPPLCECWILGVTDGGKKSDLAAT